MKANDAFNQFGDFMQVALDEKARRERMENEEHSARMAEYHERTQALKAERERTEALTASIGEERERHYEWKEYADRQLLDNQEVLIRLERIIELLEAKRP